jgi:YrbI family 3-deoxy-D-manno-octulosonate 8-phosphate phosphatase
VGSDEAVSIAELARTVQKTVNRQVKITTPDAPAENTAVNYQVPDVGRARDELGLRPLVPLDEAIRRTAEWWRQASSREIVTARPMHGVPVIAAPDAVVFDFDGVMTDNRVLTFQDEREAVLCDRADGLGITMLRSRNIPMLVLSTETNPVVAARCRKLKLECLQGIDVKETALAQWLAERGYNPARTIYVGNDINDLGCLRLVGLPVAVGDAYEAVKTICKLVLSKPGGKGAVREIAEMICAAKDVS